MTANTEHQLEFHHLANIFPLLKCTAFNELVADIKTHGLREPVWLYEGKLLDGRNRYRACQAAGVECPTRIYKGNDPVSFVVSANLIRRHLNASQRAFVALDIEQVEAELAKKRQKWSQGRGVKGKQQIADLNKGQARDKAAKAVDVNRQYVSDAKRISKADGNVADMVRDGSINLHEGKKLIVLPADARKLAIKAVANGSDVRTAIRDAKKLNYNERIKATKPRPLQGSYRIIYADPPWLYHCKQVNAADDHYSAEDHYDWLDDKQLCEYRPGNGTRTVKELADENAVLFIWVTAPMLERCFPIIKAWGFTYKTHFVWDKVLHNMGHYNSVRHELLLICTRGSCIPDTGRLIDSVQTIKRSDRHSEKPDEFYDIIDSMYDHGRKLEMFSRKSRLGWDSDGNEADLNEAEAVHRQRRKLAA